MCAKAIELNTDWWNDLPQPRKLLAMFCLLVSQEDHPTFHWNGETGDVVILNPDGSRNYEMAPPPIKDFRGALKDLKEHFSLYDKKEINFEIPLGESKLSAKIRLEQRDYFPHLFCHVIDCGDTDERDDLLNTLSDGTLPMSDDIDTVRVTVHGKVLDHACQPVAGVRLADRKSNWPEYMMEEVQPGDLASQVVFSNEQGEFELAVELTPGFLDLDEVVIVYKAPLVSQWLKAKFEPNAIETDPNNVVIRVPEPGELRIGFNLSDTEYADCEQLQISLYRIHEHFKLYNVDAKGELSLPGLVPGKYQVGIEDAGDQLICQTVEIDGSQTAELNLTLTKKLPTTLSLTISRGAGFNDTMAQEEKLAFYIYSSAHASWGRPESWELKFSEIEFNDAGESKHAYRPQPLLGGETRISITHHQEIKAGDGWTDLDYTQLHKEIQISGNPLSFQPVLLRHEFENGTIIELRIKADS